MDSFGENICIIIALIDNGNRKTQETEKIGVSFVISIGKWGQVGFHWMDVERTFYLISHHHFEHKKSENIKKGQM